VHWASASLVQVTEEAQWAMVQLTVGPEQTVSVVVVHAAVTVAPTAQGEHGPHTRFVVPAQAVVS
jgi:hypothetical protein